MGESRIAAPTGAAWELVVDGDRYVLFEWDTAVRASPATLTDAEREVLGHLLRGDSTRAIAAQRNTRPRTVANQIASIYRKLGVRSRTELIARMVGDERA